MKTKKLLIALLAVTATLFTACKENIPERGDSPLDENAGCYIYDSTSDVVIKPADGGKFLMTIAGETDTVETKVFNVLVGRNYSEAADSFEMQVVDEAAAFSFDPMVRFDKGEVVDTIEVEVLLDFGNTAELELTVPEEKASMYSASSKIINVEVDYTWLPRGKAEVVDYFLEGSTVVAVEKAKEATDSLFRLTNVFEEIAKAAYPDDYKEISTPNVHFKFILDEDYNLVSLVGNGGALGPKHYSTSGWLAGPLLGGIGELEYAYSSAAMSAYGGAFANDANEYQLSTVIFHGGGSGYFFTMEWKWTDGYPGELADPSEGEGELTELAFTNCTHAVVADAVEEVTDEVLGLSITHDVHILNFTDAGVEMNLVLVGEDLEGTFKIESNPGTAGKAEAGYFDGTNMNGCYVDVAFTKYYMTSGDVQVDVAEDGVTYTVTVDAESASGVEVKASFTGTLTAASPVPGRKSVKMINL